MPESGFSGVAPGGTAPATLNAANEAAVAAFLDERLPFKAIPLMIEEVLSRNAAKPVIRLEDVLDADTQARESALDWMQTMGYA